MKFAKKELIKEMLRYVVAGGIAFVADQFIRNLFVNAILPDMGMTGIFDWRSVVGTTLGFIVGIVVNYLVSIFYVFTNEQQKKLGRDFKSFMIFALVGIIGFFMTQAGIQVICWSFGRYEGVVYAAASFFMAGVVMFWNYLGRKIFVYKGV